MYIPRLQIRRILYIKFGAVMKIRSYSQEAAKELKESVPTFSVFIDALTTQLALPIIFFPTHTGYVMSCQQQLHIFSVVLAIGHNT